RQLVQSSGVLFIKTQFGHGSRDMAMRLLWLLLLPLLSIVAARHPELPFWDPTLSWDARVRDLLNRLTDSELVEQLSKGGAGTNGGPAPAVPRLGIRPYQWNTECLSGHGEAGPATSFPQAIGLAATFSPELVEAMARATGLEVRASYNDYSRAGNYSDHHGLTCFAPVINLLRHPYWGRNQETYGEDPHLTGVLSAAFVRGLQGGDLAANRFALAGAGCKHFAAYSGPEDFPVSRVSFNAIVPEQDLRQSFLPQFRRCLSAGSFSVMCSYNSVNGVPACANKRLLTDVLRRDWNFTGYVVSDEGALEFAVDFHKYFANRSEAAVGALQAGVNLELSPPGCPDQACIVFEHLHEAVAAGRVTRQQLLGRAYPLFYTRMRLGEFDPADSNPYSRLRLADIVQTDGQRRLSAGLAAASFVLLKNADDFLPLSVGRLNGKRVGLIGPFADNMTLMYGSYAADPMPQYQVPLRSGLARVGAVVTVWRYCLDGVLCRRRNESALLEAARMSDLLLVAVGTGQLVEAENTDRRNLSLPSGQDRLVRSLAESPGRWPPAVLLIFSGGPVDIQLAADPRSGIRAILWCGFPAQEVGVAVAAVLTGEMSPFASLPFTWYSPDQPLSSITNYTLANMTYRFLDEPVGSAPRPLYRFGQGLTFAACRVQLSELSAPVRVARGAALDLAFSASIPGSSEYSCLYSAKAYLRPAPGSRIGRNPRVWLVAMRLIAWQRGGRLQQVRMRVLPEDMQLWNGSAMSALAGDYELLIGDYFDDSCAHCRLRQKFSIV
ncbi:hypothetical protein BOX15_Mlig015495g2, partial [Macrostomum lignano]